MTFFVVENDGVVNAVDNINAFASNSTTKRNEDDIIVLLLLCSSDL